MSDDMVFRAHRKGEVCKALGIELSLHLDDDLKRFWAIVTPCQIESASALAPMAMAFEQLEGEAGAARVAALKFYLYAMQREELDANADELLFQALLCERVEGSIEERIDYVSKLFELRCGPERARRLLEHVARKVEGR